MYMAITDKDVIILYTSIIHHNCYSIQSDQALPHFL
jgi:hypothetical protein